jgi:hypothetical protein
MKTLFAVLTLATILAVPAAVSATPSGTSIAALGDSITRAVVTDNATIASVCSELTSCHFDNGAAYRVAFTTSDVTTRDYFHPSVAGQAKAATAIWTAFP